MDWDVTVTAELSAELNDEQLAVLHDVLGKYDAALAGTPEVHEGAPSIRVTMTVPGLHVGGVRDAIYHSCDTVESAIQGQFGIYVLDWVGVEAITTEEADRRLDEPTIPELVSGVEAAEILKVSRQRVHQLAAENAQFPPPVARLASGSIWLRSSVEGFAERWERKSGRPRKAS